MAREAIFIGYRRDDSADVAGRIYDALAQRFGRARLFKDVDNLKPGADFGEYIRTVLPRCRVALILMGPSWAEARDEAGRRRLDDPNDWVRIEIETALATTGLEVVPVLLNGASMPRAEELPPTLQALLRRHAAVIRRDPDFHDDVDRLATSLKASVQTGILDLERTRNRKPAPKPRSMVPVWALPATGMAAALIALLVWAPWRSLRVGQEFDDCNGAHWCPRMLVLPGGAFVMGSPVNEIGRQDNEGPQHAVTIQQFAVGKFEVTFDQWAACVARGGCTHNRNPSDQDMGRGNHPVINVSWSDAQQYVQWLSHETGKAYRLMSEAEWEYAARGRTTTPYWTGDAITSAQERFNSSSTADVGSYAANPFGLYDMSGNVMNWVQDCPNPNYVGAPSDGTPWMTGECPSHVHRGGNWYADHFEYVRSAARGQLNDVGTSDIGIRVARVL